MAQSRNIARYLTISVTQSGADAFVQGSVSTGIIPENGLGLHVLGIVVAFSNTFETISADSSVLWALTRDTKAAVPSLADDEAIITDGFSNALTTSGEVLVRHTYEYQPQQGIYLVEPTLYFQLDSTATGLTMQCNCRIYYEEVRLSEVDILRVLNNA